MTEKEVMIELLVDLGVALSKAANMLAGSGRVETPVTTAPTTETVAETYAEPTTTGYGLAKMSAKDAMDLVTATEDADTLRAIGTEEKARSSKARKGVLVAIQAKLNKLKNPPAQANVASTVEVFTASKPAMSPESVKIFTQQFNAMNETQKGQYFNGEIDSRMNPIGGDVALGADEYEDLGDAAPVTPVTSLTQDELRTKLQAYARINGPEEAHKILAHFGIKKLKELDPSKYGDMAAELA